MHWTRILFITLVLMLVACPEIPEEEYNNPIDPDIPELDTPALIIFPDSATVNLGFSVTVDIFAKGVTNLSGAYIELEYDKTKLSILSMSEGDFFAGADETIFFIEDDPLTGIVEINTSYLGGTTTNVEGTGSLASIVFTTTVTGVSLIHYTGNCELLDPNDNPIIIEGFGSGVINAQ